MFGEEIEDAARSLDHLLRDDPGRDWSVDVAALIALAYAAAMRLEGTGVSLRLANKDVVTPALERAWSELIHLRVRLKDQKDEVERTFTITNIGRVVFNEGRSSSGINRSDYRNLISVNKDRQGNEGPCPEVRYRPRRSRKRRSPEIE